MGGETTAYCLIAFLASNGARVLDGDSVSIDAPETAETLAFLRSLIDDGLMPPTSSRYEWTRPVRMLAEGKAALSVGGSYEAQTLARRVRRLDGRAVGARRLHSRSGRAPRTPGERRRLDELRHLPPVRPAAARDARARDAVAPEALARLAHATGRVPARRSAVELAAPVLPFLSQSAEILGSAVTRPHIPLYPRVSKQLQTMLEAVLTGRLAPEAAARHAAGLIEAITGLPVVRARREARTTATPSRRRVPPSWPRLPRSRPGFRPRRRRCRPRRTSRGRRPTVRAARAARAHRASRRRWRGRRCP